MFPILKVHVDEFLRIQKAAAERYIALGALGDETFAPVQGEARYDYLGSFSGMELRENEVLFISMSRFHDKAHHDEVSAVADEDAEINVLFNDLVKIVDIGRITHAEFEQAV